MFINNVVSTLGSMELKFIQIIMPIESSLQFCDSGLISPLLIISSLIFATVFV